jgi:hypothetical protein
MDTSAAIDRRGFLGLLAAGTLSLVAGGGAVAADKAAEIIELDWLRAAGPLGEGWMTGEARWRLPSGEWRTTEFRVTPERPTVWLTENAGLTFHQSAFGPTPQPAGTSPTS